MITLGVIGVVAALTIPGLMTAYKAHQLRSKFLKSYSVIQQVFKQMEADDVSLDPSDYGGKQFYKTFIRYLQAPFDCGFSGEHGSSQGNQRSICYKITSGVDSYKTLDGNETVPSYRLDDGQIALQDGTLILFENNSSTIYVSVDINGYNNPPNRWGYDLFTFHFVEGELKTMGDKGTAYIGDIYCNTVGSSEYNGITCAQKAKTDTDYFKALVHEFK